MSDDLAHRRRAASSPTSGRSGASTRARRRRCGCSSRFAGEHGMPAAGPAHAGAARGVPRVPAEGPRRAASTTSLGVARLPARLGRHPAAARGLAAAQARRAGRPRSARAVPLRRRAGPPAARRRRRAARQPAGARARPDLPRHLRPLLRARAARRRGVRAAPRRRRQRTASCSSCGAASSARAASSRTGRASPSSSRDQVERRRPRRGRATHPLFSFDGRRCVHPGTASQTFHRLVATLGLAVPDGVSPPTLHGLRHSFAVGCLLRWYREGVDPQAGSTSSRRSWATSTRPPRPST